MTDFRERYKRVGYGREDVDINRALRSQRRYEARREQRTEQFSLLRDVKSSTHDYDDQDDSVFDEEEKKRRQNHENQEKNKDTSEEETVERRWKLLEKWREEQKRKKIQEKKKAKPVFKVGVVHHKVYSPPMNKEPAPIPPAKLCRSKDNSQQKLEQPQKRVTRATEKRLAMKAVTNQQKRDDLRSKRKEQKNNSSQTNIKGKINKVELAPKDHQFKAPFGVTPIPIFGRQALEATKENLNFNMSSSILSSTTFPKTIPSSMTESIFANTDESLVSDSKRCSSINKSNNQPCDSTVDKSMNESDNAFVLKISSDDQEMFDVQESPARRKSSKIFVPAKVEMMDIEKDAKIEPPVRSLRSNKTISKSSSEDQETGNKKHRSTNRSKSRNETESTSDSSLKSTDSSINSSVSKPSKTDSQLNSRTVPENKIEPSAKRRKSVFSSAEKFESPMTEVEKSIKKIESPVNRKNSITASAEKTESPVRVSSRRKSILLPKESLKTISNKTDSESPSKRRKSSFEKTESPNKKTIRNLKESIESNFENENENENEASFVSDMRRVSLEDQELPSISRRKSIRFEKIAMEDDNDDVFALPKQIDSPNRKNLTHSSRSEMNDLEEINLMDSTFSALPKLSDKTPKSFLDDTLANFSPRSMYPKQIKELVKVSHSLVKLSPLSSSDPITDLPKETEDVHNSSLNVSLPSSDKPPAFFSPYIVASRGKDRSRKEVKSRRFSQPTLVDIPTKDTVMQNLNISVEEEERTAQYYKHILNQEIERLNELCEKWNTIKRNEEMPEETPYIIQAAVGQTKLLINKKFERFRSLVTDCENGKGEMLVTCKDLQGFWEMMYMEIRDCENRFNKLEDMKSNNWIDREVEEKAELLKQQANKKKPVTKKNVAKKYVAAKSSSLRAHIMAARKKKIESKDNEVDIEMKDAATLESSNKKIQKVEELENPNKTPVKNIRHSNGSTPKSANKWGSLLKKVHLSQTRKSTTSPLIVMKLAQKCKTPEVRLDDSIVYINSDRTPAKSILKSTKDETMSSVVKSTNKVFFSEQYMEIKEFERQSEGTFDENMVLDNINESKEPIERRLNFEDESSDSSQIENHSEIIKETEDIRLSPNTKAVESTSLKMPNITFNPVEGPLISMSPLSLEEKNTENSSMQGKSKKLKFKFEDTPENSPQSIRKKKFSAPSTPIPKRLTSKIAEDEDTSIDADKEVDNLPKAAPEEEQVEEIYLNSEGVICKRVISKKIDTPRVTKLKRSNSDAPNESERIIKVNETPTTLQLRRRVTNIPDIVIDSPNSASAEIRNKSRKPGTPHVRKQSLKRSCAMGLALTGDSDNLITEVVSTPKLRRKNKTDTESTGSGEGTGTPKIKRTNSKSIQINETVTPRTKKITSKLNNATRTNSEEEPKYISTPSSNRKSLKKSLPLDTTLTDTTENTNIGKLKRTNSKTSKDNETALQKPRRTISKLNSTTRTNWEDEPSDIPTQSSILKRKSSKRLQVNVEPNEQEAHNASIKLPRTPSLKRNNSKKSTGSIELSKNQKLSEEMTPNTRRKSLRLTRANTVNAD